MEYPFTVALLKKVREALLAQGYLELSGWLAVLAFGIVAFPFIVVLAAWPLVFCLVADAVVAPVKAIGGLVRGWREASRARAEERERQRRAEEAQREWERQEAARPKPPTRAEVRAALRAQYEQLLREIDDDPLLDATEKEAARLEAKARYLGRLDKVL